MLKRVGLPSFARPTDHINIRISPHGSKAHSRGYAKHLVCSILICMWPFGALLMSISGDFKSRAQSPRPSANSLRSKRVFDPGMGPFPGILPQKPRQERPFKPPHQHGSPPDIIQSSERLGMGPLHLPLQYLLPARKGEPLLLFGSFWLT